MMAIFRMSRLITTHVTGHSRPSQVRHVAGARRRLVVADRARVSVAESPVQPEPPTVDRVVVEHRAGMELTSRQVHDRATDVHVPCTHGHLVVADQTDVSVAERTGASRPPTA